MAITLKPHVYLFPLNIFKIVESHEDIICAPEFEILLELASSTKVKVALYVSDILSLICCICKVYNN
jgi:hypothetical protein